MLSERVNNHKIASRVQGEERERVIEELSLYQEVTKEGGKRTATGKDDIKMLLGRSPDDSDCFIMRMFFEIREKLAPDQSEQQAQIRVKMQDQFNLRKYQIKNSSNR